MTVRSIRAERGGSMVGFMGGSMTVVVVEWMWMLGLVWLTWCGLIRIFGVGLKYLHIVEVSMWVTKVLEFWWGYHTNLSTEV